MGICILEEIKDSVFHAGSERREINRAAVIVLETQLKVDIPRSFLGRQNTMDSIK
jgi:hypothetical protein